MLLLILPDLSQNQLSVPFPALNAVMVFKLTITEFIKIKLTSKQSRVPCVGFQVYYIDSRCAMCPFSATQKVQTSYLFSWPLFSRKMACPRCKQPNCKYTSKRTHVVIYCLFMSTCTSLYTLWPCTHISAHLCADNPTVFENKSRRTALSYQVHSTFTAHWSGVASMLIPNPQRDDKGKEQGGIGPITCHAFLA